MEIAQFADQRDHFDGVLQTLGMLAPLLVHTALQVAAQRQHVAYPAVGVGADHRAQLGHAVAHRGQVRDRQQRGVARQLTHHPNGAIRVDPPAP